MASTPQASITTILFTDLVNSSEVLRRLGDERAQQAFATHHERLAEFVGAHGGRELQWLGDGLMAAFPSTGDAVRCAVAMQRAARSPISGQRLEMRVGLNVGEILEQDSGSGYFGTPVVVASRLCDRAEAGQILASQLVAGLLAGRQAFRFRDLGTAELKGIEAPVGIAEVAYEAEGVVPFAGGASFVGRADELARLEGALDRAASGSGGVVMVMGEPGIGKTRTLAELASRSRGRGATALYGRCFEGEGAAPYAPFAEALGEYVRCADPDVLRKDLGPRGGAVDRIVPELRERLPDLPELPNLQPDEERARLYDAATQFLLATAERSPLLLVLDDLHWADTGTIGLLRYAARWAARGRLLVVGAYRDVELDRQHPLAEALAALLREAEYERVLLRGLERDQIGELLETLATHEVPAALVEALTRETQGNPFFLREIVLHLIEEGRIYQVEGRWTSDVSVEALGIPEGVRQVVGRRLSRLSEAANRLLAAASGFSGTFRFDVAAAASGIDETAALDALDEALEAQLLRPVGEADAYDFTHALIRHTLYAELNPSRQVRLHRHIAEAMERRLSEEHQHAGEIARQYQRSAILPGAERGVPHCLAAANRAELAAAHGEAAALLRVALELLPEGDPTRTRLEARLGLALAWDLNLEEATEVAGRAGAAIAASEGDAAAADYLAEATHAVWSVAFSPLAWRLAAEGMRYIGDRRDLTWIELRSHDIMRRDAMDSELPGIPLDSPERRELSDVLKRLRLDDRDLSFFNPAVGAIYDSRHEILRAGPVDGYTRMQAGIYRESFEDLRRGARELLDEGRLATAAMLQVLHARYELAFGQLANSDRSFAEAMEISRRGPHSPFLAVQASNVRIERAFVLGEGSEAFVDGVIAGIGRSVNVNQWVMAAAKGLAAHLCAEVGREEEALRWLSEVLPAIDRAPGWSANYPLIVTFAVRTLWALGRTDHLERIERSLREKVIAPDFRYLMSDGRLALGQLCVLTERFDEARAWFERARVVLDEEGSRPLRAIVDYVEAESIARRGMPDVTGRIDALLASALEGFGKIGMPGWTRRAQALRS